MRVCVHPYSRILVQVGSEDEDKSHMETPDLAPPIIMEGICHYKLKKILKVTKVESFVACVRLS